MKILFLGTGAADWTVNDINNSEYRRNSSALVDETLLIDPGPNVLETFSTFNVDIKKIKHVIVTHSHSDHYNLNTVQALKDAGAEIVPFKPMEEKQVGKYKISAYKANHGTCEDSVHFIIDDGNKKLFYGLDSAWLLYDEVQAIINKHVDLAVLDATIGEVPGDYRIFEHNNLTMIRQMKLTLQKHVDKFIISHMARTLHTNHKELAALMQKDDILVAYDGFILEV